MKHYDVSCDRCGDGIASNARRFELASLEYEGARSATVEATYCEGCAHMIMGAVVK